MQVGLETFGRAVGFGCHDRVVIRVSVGIDMMLVLPMILFLPSFLLCQPRNHVYLPHNILKPPSILIKLHIPFIYLPFQPLNFLLNFPFHLFLFQFPLIFPFVDFFLQLFFFSK